MIVRAAHPTDAKAICDLVNPVIRDTAITFTSAEKDPDDVARAIRETDAYFVAKDGGALVGYACYFQFRNGPGYRHTMEHSIVLAPQARGKGAGRALMQMLESHARDNAVHSLFAGVSGENPDGVRFHAAIGFREVARLPEVGYKFGRWMDLVLMQKILSTSH